MKRFILFVTLIWLGLYTSAQIKITGIVTDAITNESLPGTSIIVEGKSVGTITDIDGKYEIEANAETDVLVVSFIGYLEEKIPIGKQRVINIKLVQDVTQLSDVVVTAFGIKREKKALGYAVENVPAMKLVEGNQSNIINALQGKVAGVTITNSGGSPGASSVIMIRGGNSLSGDNQPLFVVDGIPIDNSTVAGGLIASSNRGLDINSEDIESVSILKGPAAAAMYGIKAANGAVVITTKTGKAGESKISYSGMYSFDNVIGVPEIQMVYGQGDMTNTGINPITTLSWDTTKLADTVPRYNNLKDFYRTAFTSNHNLSYSGGDEKSTIYASIGRLNQKGVMDRTSYERTSFKLKVNSSLKKNLSVGGSFNYVNSKSARTRQGSSNSGSFSSILNYPINVNMKDYLNENGSPKIDESLGSVKMDNPYWSAENNPITNRVDRFISIANISYNPMDFLNITYRIGSDMFMEKNKSVYSTGSSTVGNQDGYIGEYEAFNQIITSTLLLNFNHKIENNNFGLTLGNNVEDYYHRNTSWTGQNFIEPDFIGIENVVSGDRTVDQKITRKRIVSVFGELKYDWKSQIFLNATGRFDKSSTLPKSLNTFFYPSVGISVLASKIMEDVGISVLSDLGIDYWKIRSTWAQVGKDAPPHVLYTPMISATNTYTIDPQGFMRAVYPAGNPKLKPEFTKSFEVGTDLRLFNNRIGIDFSYYNSTSRDQILFIRMPPSAGTFGSYLNAGSITNKGIELLLSTKPVNKPNFKWDVDINFSKSKSHVNDLPGEIKQVENSDSWAYNSIGEGAAILDGSLFGIYGYAYKRDDDGNLLLNQNGMVQRDPNKKEIGDRYPKLQSGITNKIQYKNFILNFLFDISYGNQVLNGTRAAMISYGLDPLTLNRGDSVIFDGLRSTGVVGSDGKLIYEQNDKKVVLDEAYYQNIYSKVGENFVEDASWIRLRYITLTYNLPKDWFGGKISSAQLNLTGRNLLIFTKYTGVDPEINTIGAAVRGTGSIGIDNLGTPSTKGFDFSIKITF